MSLVIAFVIMLIVSCFLVRLLFGVVVCLIEHGVRLDFWTALKLTIFISIVSSVIRALV